MANLEKVANQIIKMLDILDQIDIPTGLKHASLENKLEDVNEILLDILQKIGQLTH